MEDTHSRPLCSQIMNQASINKCGGTDRLSFGRRQIIRDLLLGASNNGVHPIMELGFLPINCFVVWDTSTEANAGMWVLLSAMRLVRSK